MMSPEEERHTTAGKAAVQVGCFVSVVLALCGLVMVYYPEKPGVTRTFPGGLDKELGGSRAVLVSFFFVYVLIEYF